MCCIAGKFGEFGKSSMIRQTKTIQISPYNYKLLAEIYSFAKLFFAKCSKRVNLPNFCPANLYSISCECLLYYTQLLYCSFAESSVGRVAISTVTANNSSLLNSSQNVIPEWLGSHKVSVTLFVIAMTTKLVLYRGIGNERSIQKP